MATRTYRKNIYSCTRELSGPELYIFPYTSITVYMIELFEYHNIQVFNNKYVRGSGSENYVLLFRGNVITNKQS